METLNINTGESRKIQFQVTGLEDITLFNTYINNDAYLDLSEVDGVYTLDLSSRDLSKYVGIKKLSIAFNSDSLGTKKFDNVARLDFNNTNARLTTDLNSAVIDYLIPIIITTETVQVGDIYYNLISGVAIVSDTEPIATTGQTWYDIS